MSRALSRSTPALAAAALAATLAAACGSPEVPVEVNVANVTVKASLDNAVSKLLQPKLADANCEASPCDRDFDFPVTSPPGRVRLSDKPEVMKAGKVVKRIEVDRIALDVKQNTLTKDLPPGEVWVSYLNCEDDPCQAPPSPEQIRTQANMDAAMGTQCMSGEMADACSARLYQSRFTSTWKKVGTIPAIVKGQTGEKPFEFAEGGQAELNSELEDLDFSYLVQTTFVHNPSRDMMLPQGDVTLELKMGLTLYFDPL